MKKRFLGCVAIVALMMCSTSVWGQANSSQQSDTKSRLEQIPALDVPLVGKSAREIAMSNMELIADALDMIRPQYTSGSGPQDPRDVGIIDGRRLEFQKRSDASMIRFTYTDVLRATRGICEWEIIVVPADQTIGTNPPVSRCRSSVAFQVYGLPGGASADNPHRTRTLVGYCEDLGGPGAYQAVVMVRNHALGSAGDADCFTGHPRLDVTQQTEWAYWMLEAQEVFATRN